MYKRILLAYDGSLSGQKALLDCREIAQWSQAALTLVAVMPVRMQVVGIEGGVYDQNLAEQDRETYQGILNDGLRRLLDSGFAAQGEVLYGETVDEIARYAATAEADLIVVGHRHLEGWARRWWRGSVSKSLIEQSPCSVLVIITR
jgi:nucleotide-binding universal stress UspA family protein